MTLLLISGLTRSGLVSAQFVSGSLNGSELGLAGLVAWGGVGFARLMYRMLGGKEFLSSVLLVVAFRCRSMKPACHHLGTTSLSVK